MSQCARSSGAFGEEHAASGSSQTGGTDTVAAHAVIRPGSSNGGVPICAINEARKDGSIIETGSGNTARDKALPTLA